jgi:hypothetical protein
MQNSEVHSDCRGGNCGFGIWGDDLNCGGPGRDCGLAEFLECEESNFHDANLVKATTAIRAVLSLIPPDQDGRNLSLIQTSIGVVLAWVNHTDAVIEGAITQDSDADEILTALKVKVPTAY